MRSCQIRSFPKAFRVTKVRTTSAKKPATPRILQSVPLEVLATISVVVALFGSLPMISRDFIHPNRSVHARSLLFAASFFPAYRLIPV